VIRSCDVPAFVASTAPIRLPFDAHEKELLDFLLSLQSGKYSQRSGKEHEPAVAGMMATFARLS
jgi:hypothetical protein